jgi:hypothetical protein
MDVQSFEGEPEVIPVAPEFVDTTMTLPATAANTPPSADEAIEPPPANPLGRLLGSQFTPAFVER